MVINAPPPDRITERRLDLFEALTFHPHNDPVQMERLRRHVASHEDLRALATIVDMMSTAIRAAAVFPNGWTASVITADTAAGPPGLREHLFAASRQDGTYEVMAWGPEGETVGPLGHMPASAVSGFLLGIMDRAPPEPAGH